jgi:hypothetical protein
MLLEKFAPRALVVAVVSAACLLTAPAFAADAPAAQSQPDKAAKPDDKGKLVCTDVQTVGSRISKHTCKTPAQVAEDQYHAQQMRDKMRNDRPIQSTAGQGN